MLALDAASRPRCEEHLHLYESHRTCSHRLHRAHESSRVPPHCGNWFQSDRAMRASCPSATSWQCINASAGSYHLTKWHRPTGLRRCSIASAVQEMSSKIEHRSKDADSVIVLFGFA